MINLLLLAPVFILIRIFDSWTGSVKAICFRCLPQREGASFALKGLSAQPGGAYHSIDRQAFPPWNIIAIEISTSCFSLPVVGSGIG